MKTVKVEFTPKFVIVALVALILLFGAWELREILLGVGATLLIAFILSAGFRPLVDSLEKSRILYPLEWVFNRLAIILGTTDKKQQRLSKISDYFGEFRLGRGLVIAVIYIGLFSFIVIVALSLTSQLVTQVGSLVGALPGIFDRVVTFILNTVPVLGKVLPLKELQTELGTFVANFASSPEFLNLLSGQNILTIFNQTVGIFSSAAELVLSVITVVILSVYMLMRREPVYEGILNLLPPEQAEGPRNVLGKIESSLGNWLGGQLVLMITIGLITYSLIVIPGVFDPSYRLDEFAFPIALMAGLLEAIPTIGPAITLIVSTILALGTSGLGIVLYVIVSFTVLQNLEAVFIVPTVMKRAIGLDPIMSILGIIAGFQVGGVLGAILAIPVIGIVQIIVLGVSEEYKLSYSKRPLKLID